MTTRHFTWGHSGVRLTFMVDQDDVVSLQQFVPAEWSVTPVAGPQRPANLAEVRTVEHGSVLSGNRTVNTAIGERLRYRGHEGVRRGDLHHLCIRLADDDSAMAVDVDCESLDGSSWISVRTTVTNRAAQARRLLAVSSCVIEVPLSTRDEFAHHRVWWARNEWLAECRWESELVRPTLLPDSDRILHPIDNRGALARSSLAGGWPTSRYLPTGMLEDESSGLSYAWQVESMSGWRWEVGDRLQSLYIASFGPTDRDHSWSVELKPDESFTSPSTTVGVSRGGWQSAMRSLTQARQSRRVDHPSFRSRPIVFNDYMNAIHGDPTEEKLNPLIDAAGAAGAEIFCIDAGWFDDGETWWWDSLGDYRVSSRRFPRGIDVVLDRIRERGMVPGMWLEPEVIGVRSPLASQLPQEAFFHRGGLKLAGICKIRLRHLYKFRG